MEKQREGAFIKPQKQAFAHQTDCHERTVALVAVQQYSEVSVGEIPWERRSHTRHFYSMAFPGFKERFSVGTHVSSPER